MTKTQGFYWGSWKVQNPSSWDFKIVDESTAVDLELNLTVRLEFSISSRYAESGF